MSLKCSVGGRDSESFASVAEADQFIANTQSVADMATWDALSDEQKEYRLRLAAQLFGMLPLRGKTVYCGQALCFPRSKQGAAVTSLPDVVKEAQSYIALGVIHRALEATPGVDEGAVDGSTVTQISLAGLLMASFSGKAIQSGNALDLILRSPHFPIYILLKRYLSQIRGGSVPDLDDDGLPTCSTTTTTTTTTTTSSSSSSSSTNSTTTTTT